MNARAYITTKSLEQTNLIRRPLCMPLPIPTWLKRAVDEMRMTEQSHFSNLQHATPDELLHRIFFAPIAIDTAALIRLNS